MIVGITVCILSSYLHSRVLDDWSLGEDLRCHVVLMLAHYLVKLINLRLIEVYYRKHWSIGVRLPNMPLNCLFLHVLCTIMPLIAPYFTITLFITHIDLLLEINYNVMKSTV